MQTANFPAIAVSGDVIHVIPHNEHEYVLPTAAVAQGYGVKEASIRSHLTRHADELIEGKHWFSVAPTSKGDSASCLGVANCNAWNFELKQTLWTKRGIVRLGFFIRSARAKLFRDLAEDLVVGQMEKAAEPQPPALATVEMVATLLQLNQKMIAGMTKMDRRISDMEVEHRFMMTEWVNRPTAPSAGLPEPQPAAEPRRKKMTLAKWLRANYQVKRGTRTVSRTLYEHYREDFPDAKETPPQVNAAVGKVFGMKKRRWNGR